LGQVVDRDHLEAGVTGCSAVGRDSQQVPPDAAHPVDAYSHAHVLSFPLIMVVHNASGRGSAAAPTGDRPVSAGRTAL
jgi:hypothetical protein